MTSDNDVIDIQKQVRENLTKRINNEGLEVEQTKTRVNK